MKFRYSLQKVLDLKNSEKNQAEWMLSEAIGKLQMEERQLNSLLDEQHAEREALISGNGLTISTLVARQNYLDYLEREIQRKSSDVEQAHLLVMEKQQNLHDKVLDEKVWTKAKEKAYRKHLTFILKKEQGELDEMATLRHQIGEI